MRERNEITQQKFLKVHRDKILFIEKQRRRRRGGGRKALRRLGNFSWNQSEPKLSKG